MKPDQESKLLSQERFSRFAEGYVASQSHAQGLDLDRLVEIANPQADWLVLDVASGGGHTALKFAPRVKQVIATDLTPEMLAAAENYIREQDVTNIAFDLADAEDLPFADGSFDLVTCRIAPHHFSEGVLFIQEGRRVLKPGGLLLVQDHVLPEDESAARYIDNFERRRDPSHNRAFSQMEWEALFQQAGLKIVHVEEIVKSHQLSRWAERQGCSPEVIAELSLLLAGAPPIVAAWLQISDLDSDHATFVNHHILIAGQKNAAAAP